VRRQPVTNSVISLGISIIVLFPFDQDHNYDERDDTQEHQH
jgi:hypothetical protein